MSRRSFAITTDVLSRGIAILDVLGPFRVTLNQVVVAAVFASFAAGMISAIATPPEVWRERQAVGVGNGDRVINRLVMVFLAISLVLNLTGRNASGLHGEWAFGSVRVTRYQLVQASLLIALGIMLVIEPLYHAWRVRHVRERS